MDSQWTLSSVELHKQNPVSHKYKYACVDTLAYLGVLPGGRGPVATFNDFAHVDIYM